MKTNWLPGPIQPLLGREHVHVWLGELDVGAEQLASYRSLLSEDESDRAVRFRFDRHRNSYIAGRGMLRLLLARYLKADPKGIEFSYSEYGKPFIPTSELQFNLAHSGDLALAAFTLGRDIGVDLERERELSDALAIGDRFFSPGEREILRSLAEQEQLPAFFRFLGGIEPGFMIFFIVMERVLRAEGQVRDQALPV